MDGLKLLGPMQPALRACGTVSTERVVVRRRLARVMAFLGRSIDQLVNDPMARQETYGFYKLDRWIERTCETVDLERWWNGRGL